MSKEEEEEVEEEEEREREVGRRIEEKQVGRSCEPWRFHTLTGLQSINQSAKCKSKSQIYIDLEKSRIEVIFLIVFYMYIF